MMFGKYLLLQFIQHMVSSLLGIALEARRVRTTVVHSHPPLTQSQPRIQRPLGCSHQIWTLAHSLRPTWVSWAGDRGAMFASYLEFLHLKTHIIISTFKHLSLFYVYMGVLPACLSVNHKCA